MNTLILARESYPVGFAVMSGGLGAILGSFLGVVAERVPGMVMDEENCGNLLFPASHCPVCQHSLHAWENIPLISWLVLRGALSLLPDGNSTAVIFNRTFYCAVFGFDGLVHTRRSGIVLDLGAGGLFTAAGDD